VTRVLRVLNIAAKPEDMNLPGFRFHRLRGKPQRFAVDASGNYRITFGWDEPDAIDVDIEDYH
jgi:proteic killer suppression protein